MDLMGTFSNKKQQTSGFHDRTVSKNTLRKGCSSHHLKNPSEIGFIAWLYILSHMVFWNTSSGFCCYLAVCFEQLLAFQLSISGCFLGVQAAYVEAQDFSAARDISKATAKVAWVWEFVVVFLFFVWRGGRGWQRWYDTQGAHACICLYTIHDTFFIYTKLYI